MPTPNLEVNEINRFLLNLVLKLLITYVSDFKVTFPTISSIFFYDDINVQKLSKLHTYCLILISVVPMDFLVLYFKKIVDYFSFPLSKIFNKSVLEGFVPSQLKIAKVIPIFIPGDKTKLINYRPISILPTISKVLERLIYKRMMKFINKYNILTTCQYGFRSINSTNFAIIDLINARTQHLNNKSKAAALFIDISKAFDSLNHNILLRKLKAYGFKGLTYNWLSSCLNNRYQFFFYIADTKSFLSSITLDVPQGSVLGLLSFLFYINDLPLLTNLSNFILFAHDTKVLFHAKSYEALSKLINSSLVLLHAWFVNDRLSLNLIKTCVVPFSLKTYVNLDNLHVNNVPVRCVPSTKFLGFYIDYNLSWKVHTNAVFNKLSQCWYA